MSPMNGVWELQSFVIEAGGKMKEPFGKDPVGLLVFSGPPGDDSYMGALLTTGPAGTGRKLNATKRALFDSALRRQPT